MGGAAQAATFFTDSCSGGGASLTCTFTANSGFLFIDSSAADLNLSGTVTSASETFTGGNATSSSIDTSANQQVDGFGRFNLTDNLQSTGSPGNPTAATITLTILGTGLGLTNNTDGNSVAAHICQVSTGTACSSTFFALPNGTVSAVPLPGALTLFATGLAGLVLVGRRRKKQAAAFAA
jgi:hypothetical protein